jgi:hypothetical protein
MKFLKNVVIDALQLFVDSVSSRMQWRSAIYVKQHEYWDAVDVFIGERQLECWYAVEIYS